MTTVSLRTELDISEDAFWDTCILSEEFNRRLFLEWLKFGGYRLLEQKEENGKLWKRQEVEPSVQGIPGPLKKLLGERLSYVEEGTFDRATHTYTFKTTPSTMADKTRIAGTMRTEKLGENRCVRIVDVTIEVKVFAVGSMAEDKIATDLRASYQATVEFMRTYLKEKGL
jgi:hypothetical protein